MWQEYFFLRAVRLDHQTVLRILFLVDKTFVVFKHWTPVNQNILTYLFFLQIHQQRKIACVACITNEYEQQINYNYTISIAATMKHCNTNNCWFYSSPGPVTIFSMYLSMHFKNPIILSQKIILTNHWSRSGWACLQAYYSKIRQCSRPLYSKSARFPQPDYKGAATCRNNNSYQRAHWMGEVLETDDVTNPKMNEVSS